MANEQKPVEKIVGTHLVNPADALLDMIKRAMESGTIERTEIDEQSFAKLRDFYDEEIEIDEQSLAKLRYDKPRE